jgi:hypothetical protein
MKKRDAAKKLILSRESLRLLEKSDLPRAFGGHTLNDTICVECYTITTTCC